MKSGSPKTENGRSSSESKNADDYNYNNVRQKKKDANNSPKVLTR